MFDTCDRLIYTYLYIHIVCTGIVCVCVLSKPKFNVSEQYVDIGEYLACNMTKYVVLIKLKLYCSPYVRVPLCWLLPEVVVVQQTRKHCTETFTKHIFTVLTIHMHLERGRYNTRMQQLTVTRGKLDVLTGLYR